MPKWPLKSIGWLVAAAVAALGAAAILNAVTHHGFGLSGEAVREGALNVASLVVAFLLVAGIGRSEKKDKR